MTQLKQPCGIVQVDMESARSKELQFFKANPRYADLKNVGMNFLSGKLSNHLIGAIRRQLPAIQNQINTGVWCRNACSV